jgi:HK97 family phage major capsid protein
MVRDDLVKVMGLREDLAFLRNDGSGDLPKGAVSWCPAGNNLGATAATAVAAEAGLRGLINKIEIANVDMTNCGFVMHPGAKNWLAGLRDVNGFYLFPSLQSGTPTLLGYNVFTTTQLPTNLGGGTNGTEVLFLNFGEMVIGDSMIMQIATSTEASYWTGAAYVSAFATDVTLMRAVSEHDFAPMHDVAIAMLTGTAWAA